MTKARWYAISLRLVCADRAACDERHCRRCGFHVDPAYLAVDGLCATCEREEG